MRGQGWQRPGVEPIEPLLKISGLSKTYEKRYLVQASDFSLQDIGLELFDGEVVGILGESGSGKSTVANIIVKLAPFDAGQILYRGKDIRSFDAAENFRYKSEVQIVFQDPFGSLNPRATIRRSIQEGLVLHRRSLSAREMEEEIDGLLARVGLAGESPDKYPHEFSGGQRQRVAIARALAVRPSLLICDEPLSSLDVSIQAQILELFVNLLKDLGLTILFISHDINVVRLLCDRVYVMRDGRIVESGASSSILADPKHEYTRNLLDAVF